jgi:hypothetical protein
VVIHDNSVVVIDTTLTGLRNQFLKIEKQCPAYITLYQKFTPLNKPKTDAFTLTLSGKVYHFQKVVP